MQVEGPCCTLPTPTKHLILRCSVESKVRMPSTMVTAACQAAELAKAASEKKQWKRSARGRVRRAGRGQQRGMEGATRHEAKLQQQAQRTQAGRQPHRFLSRHNRPPAPAQ